VSYSLETTALSEEHRLRVFENRGLRRIFGPKEEEVTGRQRKVKNKKTMYSSPIILRKSN
jgi:hypothetical protein